MVSQGITGLESNAASREERRTSFAQSAFESILILVAFFIYAGWPVPAVNEAHYLVKAKHFWDSNWCPGDLFTSSANAHYFFYVTFGALTRFLPLEYAAWTCRMVTWLLLAIAWQRLSFSLVPRPLVSVLSAAMFLALLHHTHMAGEWVVGGTEAKGIAYACVWMGVAALAKDRWRRAIVWMGLAVAWHVLVGGWALVALAFAWSCDRQRPSYRTLIGPCAIAFVLAMPGWLPAISMNRGVSAEILDEANRIHVFDRLSHHLVFHRFSHLFMFRHVCAIVVWSVLGRAAWISAGGRRVWHFVAGAVVIALVGVVIDQSLLYRPSVAARLLRFYWFRMSDALVPLGLSLAIVQAWQHLRSRESPLADWSLIGLILGVSGWLGAHYATQMRDLRPQVDRNFTVENQIAKTAVQKSEMRLAAQRENDDWIRVCRWIAENTAPSDWVITPRDRQSFKWYTGHAEFVCRKDVPQDAVSVCEWKRRVQLLHGDPTIAWAQRVATIANRYPVRYVIVHRKSPYLRLPYPQVYPMLGEMNSHFAVYRVVPLEPVRSPASDGN